jgi:glycine hydroxymethyltransferase
MAVTLAEWIKFGKSFAGQMVANAKALGKAMDAQGFDVVAKHKGYTESHIVAVDVNKQGGGNKVADALSEANINVSAWRVWKPEEDFHGLRIGVTEMTRYGMKEGEMSSIAEFMRRVAIDKEDPTEVGKEVAVFRKPFNEVHYCFEKP